MLRASLKVFVLVSLLFSSRNSGALTLEDLRGAGCLTPERFAEFFAAFSFELSEKVQAPEQFLARERGDCDDYATLAAMILAENGYHPRLVVVFMPKVIHVVCYIPEARAYLDYNLRKTHELLMSAPDDIQGIAEKVASTFSARWYCAAEFLQDGDTRRFLTTEFPAGPAAPGSSGEQVSAKLAR